MIKSPLHRKALGLLDMVAPVLPDALFLRIKYRILMGTRLHLSHPQSFNEKIQWLKIHDRKPVYRMMADKIAAKEYVAAIIGREHIIPTLATYDIASQIDIGELPERFVLKCSHDSGGLAICRDKSSFKLEEALKGLQKALDRNFYFRDREWAYKGIPHRILAEKYMDDGSGGLVDYKFYCFDGEPQYLYVSSGLENHSTAHISFLTLEWEFAPFNRSDYRPFAELPPKPSGYEKMLDIARKLSAGHKFLRVDLYQIDGQVYFSELTFYPCGGYMPFNPAEWDFRLGELLEI